MINNKNQFGIILERILVVILIAYSIFLLLNATTFKDPIMAGDGHEYLGMTISFFNHFSPDLREEDINLRSHIENKNGINISEDFNYNGYYSSLNGAWYSYHFWGYSLLNLPIFGLLHYMDFNELRCFQITNSLLLILCLLGIIYFIKFKDSIQKMWFFLFSAFSPVLFYVQWPHPEVFSYTFVGIAIAFATRRNYILSVLMSSIASLQNPPILILTLYLIVLGWKQYDYDLKKFVQLSCAASISSVSFIFYYLNYQELSLIASQGLASISYISTDKILSLFFDLNYGILAYTPLLLLFSLSALIISIIKKDFFILELWVVLILMATLASTAADLSCGTMYIHRYAVWMIPIIILITVYSVQYYSVQYFTPNKVNAWLSIAVIINISITGYYLCDYNTSNYLKLNSLSETVLVCTPGLYNPPKQVFVDRSLEQEFSCNDWFKILPVIYMYDGMPRKILTNDGFINNIDLSDIYSIFDEFDDDRLHQGIGEEGAYYINNQTIVFNLPIDTSKIQVFMKPATDDIVSNCLLDRNWYRLESLNGTPTRWMHWNAALLIYSAQRRSADLNLQAVSLNRTRSLEIYINDIPYAWAEVPSEDFVIVNVPINLNKGTNIIRFHVPEGCERPCDTPELKNDDRRWLSVAVQNISINYPNS
jgi:hypothetical protein